MSRGIGQKKAETRVIRGSWVDQGELRPNKKSVA